MTTRRPLRVYLAGPMRGYDLSNFPAFDEAAAWLRAWGAEVFNPAEYDRECGNDGVVEIDNNSLLRTLLGADLAYITSEADCIVVLPGWQKSAGVACEVATAAAIKMPVYEYTGLRWSVDHGGSLVVDITTATRLVKLSDKGACGTDTPRPSVTEPECVEVAGPFEQGHAMGEIVMHRLVGELAAGYRAGLAGVVIERNDGAGGFVTLPTFAERHGFTAEQVTLDVAEPEPGEVGDPAFGTEPRVQLGFDWADTGAVTATRDLAAERADREAWALAWDRNEVDDVRRTNRASNGNRRSDARRGKLETNGRRIGDANLSYYPPDAEVDGFAYTDESGTVHAEPEAFACSTLAAKMGDEVQVTSPTGGTKGVKAMQLGAIDPVALVELGLVAGMGSAKYDRYNYLSGFDWSSCVDALYRHFLLWQAGDDTDDESGLDHMAHVAWQALALVSFRARSIGNDNRPPRF